MTEPSPAPPIRASRRQKPPRGPVLGLLIVLALAAAGAAYYFLSRPKLDFNNRLAGPVRLTVNSGEPLLVPAGQSLRVTVPGGKTLVATWELVRPLSADGRPMGEEVQGSLVEGELRGTVHLVAENHGVQGDYFAPLITNATDDILRVTVNVGLEGAVDCRCAVRPGARRVFIGYYRLYRNSTVQAKSPDGRTAMFRDLGPNVVVPDGALGLRFESKDLRAR